MKKTWWVIMILLLVIHFINGQEGTFRDTIRIPDILITNSQTLQSDERLVDSIFISKEFINNTADYLNRNSDFFIRSSGPGLSSTLLINGCNSSQTKVFWNGFDISNSMLGLTDLSILNYNKDIQTFVSSNDVRNGAIGGSINMNSILNPAKKEFNFELAANDIDNFNLNAYLHKWIGKWTHTSNIGINRNYNNYRYSGNHIDRFVQNAGSYRINFDYKSMNIRKFSTNTFLVNALQSQREIPPSIYESYSDAVQYDISAKIAYKYDFEKNNFILKARSGLFYNNIKYDNIKINDHSDSDIYRNETAIYLGYKFFEVLSPSVEVNYKIDHIESDIYNVDIASTIESNFRLNLNIKKTNIIGGWNCLNSEGKYYYNNPYLKFKMDVGRYTIGFDAGNNIRLPSYNDRFWNKIQTIELLPENSKYLELSLTSRQLANFRFSISTYHKKIENQIIWLPLDGIWQAQKSQKVRSAGLDFSTFFDIHSESYNFYFQQNYKYNNSYIEDLDKGFNKTKSIYFPSHLVTLKQVIEKKKFKTFFQEKYIDKVYTTFDNTDYINSYILFDFRTQRNYNFENFKVSIYLEVSNILNYNYETIKNYPMPGRTFKIGFAINYR